MEKNAAERSNFIAGIPPSKTRRNMLLGGKKKRKKRKKREYRRISQIANGCPKLLIMR